MPLSSVLEFVTGQAPLFTELSDRIWDTPELGLHETKSSATLADALEAAGFAVERGVAGMPTAFIATYGQGAPVIAVLGEFDALPGLSQQRGATEHRPIVPNGPGHGCGHNLLGTAAAAAAMAVRHAIRRGEVKGTVRFYGCPAEETLVGKTFLVKEGRFKDVDCALTWHPGAGNQLMTEQHTAMNSARFTFHGVASHAAAMPENGRSALDAVELMNVGANFLREHVHFSTRLHYVITDGGLAPNVVPNRAEVWYYVRAPRRSQVEDVYARLLDIARGACLMTGTTHEVRLVAGCYDTLPNKVLDGVLQRTMEAIGAPTYTTEEKALARALQATFPEGALRKGLDDLRRRGVDLGQPGDPGTDLVEQILPPPPYGEPAGGSTDVGDVSYVVPTAEMRTVTAPVGMPGHSWQNAVSVGSPIGRRGMLFAAQILAAAVCDLMKDPDLVQRAKDEHRDATVSTPYVSPVRDVPGPALDL
ncbi:MAG TPA: amidohydrolase [bacterium]|nr:amidohydrolase [bacterium]